jgi:hypothetical protein
LSIERNVTKPEHNHLSVVVGGTVEAALQANVTIHCPVKGKYYHFQCEGIWPTNHQKAAASISVFSTPA